jgi:hypothetical protein
LLLRGRMEGEGRKEVLFLFRFECVRGRKS